MHRHDAEERLRRIHSNLVIDHGNIEHEYEEQLMAVTFVRPEARVLELGGNIGRSSCVIASVLRSSDNLVVFESDPGTARQLTHNRDRNGFGFAVEAAALSERRLIQRGWDTVPWETPDVPAGWTVVATMTWDEVRRKHGEFDTLVADCEGAVYYIVKDQPDFFMGFDTVLIENDFLRVEHKQFVDRKLAEAGFECVYRKAGDVPEYLPCKERFYEVWKK